MLTEEQGTELRRQLAEVETEAGTKQAQLMRLNQLREQVVAEINAMAGRKYQIELWLEASTKKKGGEE